MLTNDERHAANELLGEAAVSLIYCPGNRMGEYGDELHDWARDLSIETNGRVSVMERGGETPFGAPCLSIGDRIHYLAIPKGSEFRLFIDTLSRGCNVPRKHGDAAPAELIVFMATGCPHCPLAVKTGVDFALDNPEVICIVADVQRNTELAERFKVQSVPMTLLDRGMSWMGVETSASITEKLCLRGTPAFQSDVFRSVLTSGRIDDVVEMVLAFGGAERFARLWQQSNTALRIPLMLVAEEVLMKSPDALTLVVKDIGQAVDATDAALRGDTADLLGQIGHPDAAPFVEKLLDDPNPDVAEIAEETLESLRNGQ